MCNYHQQIIFTETEKGQVSWCSGCRSYSVVFNSCVMAFTQKELEQFIDLITNLTDNDFQYNFKNEKHVLIKNQFAFIGICLTYEDLNLLADMVNESLTLTEVFKIIYH
ncbi:MAG: DUF6686 family protein [Candidatus Cyclobacteriaceae bacterium M2_1C_046]